MVISNKNSGAKSAPLGHSLVRLVKKTVEINFYLYKGSKFSPFNPYFQSKMPSKTLVELSFN
jgi:hypothetical protein